MSATLSAVRILLVVTIIGYLLQGAAGQDMAASLALWPLQTRFMPWQLVTYAFLHASLTHLAFNMIGLWMFGR